MEREVEETVHQYSETSGQRAGRNSSPIVVSRISASETHSKKADYEEQTDCGTDDAGV